MDNRSRSNRNDKLRRRSKVMTLLVTGSCIAVLTFGACGHKEGITDKKSASISEAVKTNKKYVTVTLTAKNIRVIATEETHLSDIVEKISGDGIKSAAVTVDQDFGEVQGEGTLDDNNVPLHTLVFNKTGETTITITTVDNDDQISTTKIKVTVLPAAAKHIDNITKDVRTVVGKTKPDYQKELKADTNEIAGFEVDDSGVDYSTTGEYDITYHVTTIDQETVSVPGVVKVVSTADTADAPVIIGSISVPMGDIADDKENKGKSEKSDKGNQDENLTASAKDAKPDESSGSQGTDSISKSGEASVSTSEKALGTGNPAEDGETSVMPKGEEAGGTTDNTKPQDIEQALTEEPKDTSNNSSNQSETPGAEASDSTSQATSKSNENVTDSGSTSGTNDTDNPVDKGSDSTKNDAKPSETASESTPETTKGAAASPTDGASQDGKVWVPPVIERRTLWVQTSAAYDETVETKEEVTYYVFEDGYRTKSPEDADTYAKQTSKNGIPASYSEETVEEVTGSTVIRHPAEGHNEWKDVVIQEGYWK